jgi:hypothetical protein
MSVELQKAYPCAKPRRLAYNEWGSSAWCGPYTRPTDKGRTSLHADNFTDEWWRDPSADLDELWHPW